MKTRHAITLSILLLTSACSSGKPSDTDVEKIVRQEIREDVVSYLGSMINDKGARESVDTRVSELTVIVGDKNKQADGSYTAIFTVRAPAKAPGFLTTFHLPTTGTVHMLKSADGWVLIKDPEPVNSGDQ